MLQDGLGKRKLKIKNTFQFIKSCSQPLYPSRVTPCTHPGVPPMYPSRGTPCTHPGVPLVPIQGYPLYPSRGTPLCTHPGLPLVPIQGYPLYPPGVPLVPIQGYPYVPIQGYPYVPLVPPCMGKVTEMVHQCISFTDHLEQN